MDIFGVHYHPHQETSIVTMVIGFDNGFVIIIIDGVSCLLSGVRIVTINDENFNGFTLAAVAKFDGWWHLVKQKNNDIGDVFAYMYLIHQI